jgi:hypothetical protein
VFPYTLGTFSIKERVFPYTLGTFSIKEGLLVLRHNSYNAAERVFPCTLGTFSVKRERVYGCSRAQFVRFWVRKIKYLLVLAWTRIRLETQGFGTGGMH